MQRKEISFKEQKGFIGIVSFLSAELRPAWRLWQGMQSVFYLLVWLFPPLELTLQKYFDWYGKREESGRSPQPPF